MADGPVVLDMAIPRNRRFMFLITVKGRLNIEMKTGMSPRISTLRLMRQNPECGITFTTRKKAAAWVQQELDKIWEEVRATRN